ncbi:lysylphosphatidylglycerol synthase transmembrane domain-containing protein [Natrinema caseinilyticum]|uniref:lysylphosphatidylglycerol synthase transmembrane domain-containing protein n=1 Tax=Natrinema caseinilyticum TaxID=2961570 RepID=UPI0020C3194E|nr:lysylphosphatidylglycerol synthase transmembrane domain-containing protein [Natrinema caseinilyticum]
MEGEGERTGPSAPDAGSVSSAESDGTGAESVGRGASRENACEGSPGHRFTAALTRRRLTVAGTMVVLLGLVVVIRELDVRTVASEISSADPLVLAGAVAVYAVSWPLRGRRYRDVLAAMDHRSDTAFATIAIFVSQTANLAVPARAGDAVRAHVLRTNRDVPYSAGFASLAVERVFDLTTIAALAALAAAWLALGDAAGTLRTVASADGARITVLSAATVSLAAAGVGLAVVTSARADHGLGAWVRDGVGGRPRLERAVTAGLRFATAVQTVARQPRALGRIGAGSLAVWSLDVCTAVLVLAALGSDLAFATLVAVGTLAVSVGNLAKVLPLSQGGVGLYEAAFTALIVGLTPIGASTALAAAIVDHALKNAVTLVGGAGGTLALGLSLSDATGEPDPTRNNGSFLGEPKR